MPTANGSAAEQSSAMLGFEAKLWRAADKLRNNMDAAEYEHVVHGLIFLKYISDTFEEKYAALAGDKKSGADPEDLLQKYGYPPDKQEAATNTVLQHAELLSDFWTEHGGAST